MKNFSNFKRRNCEGHGQKFRSEAENIKYEKLLTTKKRNPECKATQLNFCSIPLSKVM